MTTNPNEPLLITPDEVRSLITTGIGLGYDAATIGITRDRAIRDAMDPGPIDRLLAGLRTASDLRHHARGHRP